MSKQEKGFYGYLCRDIANAALTLPHGTPQGVVNSVNDYYSNLREYIDIAYKRYKSLKNDQEHVSAGVEKLLQSTVDFGVKK